MTRKLLFVLLLVQTVFVVNAQVIKGTYAIRNEATGLQLRIKDANSSNGTPIVMYNPIEWKCMTWDFQHVDGNVYQLKNLFSGKTLQPTSSQALEEQPLKAGDAQQQFEFIKVDKDHYFIKQAGTDLYLTAQDKANGKVSLQKKSDTPLQQWTIYEQHPTM